MIQISKFIVAVTEEREIHVWYGVNLSAGKNSRWYSGAAKGTKMKKIWIFSGKAAFWIILCFKLSSFKKSLVPYILSPLNVFFGGLNRIEFFI